MHQLAYFSIDRLRSPLGEIPSPCYVEQRALIRTAAEIAEGCVSHEDMLAASQRSVASLSVWDSPAALDLFVKGPVHRPFVLRRDEWFERPSAPQEVVWWVSSLKPPTVGEAARRLKMLREQGPSLRAFTLNNRFPPN